MDLTIFKGLKYTCRIVSRDILSPNEPINDMIFTQLQPLRKYDFLPFFQFN